MEEITISVVIAERSYKITINKNDEELIRKAVQDINQIIKNFSDLYAYKDKQDLLAMSVLQINTAFFKQAEKIRDENIRVEEKINELSEILTQTI